MGLYSKRRAFLRLYWWFWIYSALGHQPKELIDTAIQYLQNGAPCIADQTSFQIPAAKLSEALQDWLLAETGRLYQIFLASGGAEAIDLSLRHVLLQWEKVGKRVVNKN